MTTNDGEVGCPIPIQSSTQILIVHCTQSPNSLAGPRSGHQRVRVAETQVLLHVQWGWIWIIQAEHTPPPPQLPNGDIAERVNDYLSAPHIPWVHWCLRLHLHLIVFENAGRTQPLLTPLTTSDADNLFRVTNFRHVSPTSASSSGHLLWGGDGGGSGNGEALKKHTKSHHLQVHSLVKPNLHNHHNHHNSSPPSKSFIPTPILPSPKLSFFDSSPFQQAMQARRSSTSLGSGSLLLLPTSYLTAQLANVSSSMQDESRNGRTSINSVFLLPPVGSSALDARSQMLTSMTRGGNGSLPMPSPTATSFRGASEIHGERGKSQKSRVVCTNIYSSSYMFAIGHTISHRYAGHPLWVDHHVVLAPQQVHTHNIWPYDSKPYPKAVCQFWWW